MIAALIFSKVWKSGREAAICLRMSNFVMMNRFATHFPLTGGVSAPALHSSFVAEVRDLGDPVQFFLRRDFQNASRLPMVSS